MTEEETTIHESEAPPREGPNQAAVTGEETAAETEPAVEPLSTREIWTNRFRYFLVGVAIVCIAGIGYLVLTRGVSSPGEVTVSTLTPTNTSTATITLTPTATPRPPTETPTPGPTPRQVSP